MQITATGLRKNLFGVFERAKRGEEVLVSHKGDRFRIVPEIAGSKLGRITPLQVLNPEWTASDDERTKKQMWDEIEADWDGE